MPLANSAIDDQRLVALSASELFLIQGACMPSHSEVSEDYLTEGGARALASRIQHFWRALGYKGASAWTEPGVQNGKSYFIVRSNLICGIPPGGRTVL